MPSRFRGFSAPSGRQAFEEGDEIIMAQAAPQAKTQTPARGLPGIPSRGSSRSRLAYVLLIPAMAVIALVVIYPLFYGIKLSLTNMNMYNFRNPQLVGLKNYVTLLSDKQFWTIFLRTIVWTVVNVFFHVAIGLWLAILLHRRLPGKAVFRTLLILPWAVPQYIAALVWRGMFNYQYGAVNLLLVRFDKLLDSFFRLIGVSKGFSIEPVAWLQDPVWAFVAVILTNVWLGFPFMMVTFLGGLQGIPGELYEASEVDGATGWQKFRFVTLPMLRPVMVPAVVLGTVWTFNMVNIIYIITQGGPNESTHILVTYLYRAAFDFYRYGYAAAVSVFIFLFLLIFSSRFVRAMRGTEGVY